MGHYAGDRVSDWAWPDELDALTAAPQHHLRVELK
jgi:hypothetical protein